MQVVQLGYQLIGNLAYLRFRKGPSDVCQHEKITIALTNEVIGYKDPSFRGKCLKHWFYDRTIIKVLQLSDLFLRLHLCFSVDLDRLNKSILRWFFASFLSPISTSDFPTQIALEQASLAIIE